MLCQFGAFVVDSPYETAREKSDHLLTLSGVFLCKERKKGKKIDNGSEIFVDQYYYCNLTLLLTSLTCRTIYLPC